MLTKLYYTFKFLVPRPLQIWLRRYLIQRKRALHADVWPIDKNAVGIRGIGGHDPGIRGHDLISPEIRIVSPNSVKNSGSCPHIPPEFSIVSPDSAASQFPNWPNNKKFALVLTHDVETAAGLDTCVPLAVIDERFGFRSSFNFVPGDYLVPEALRRRLTDRGFEVGVHGLHHNNNPFRSKSIFLKQAIEINRYLKEWGAVGFRCPSMYHDLELLHHLNIEYDASTFDTDPFEPQPDGMGTIFPFWVPNQYNQKGYVELPYTLPQDFLVFILMKEKNISIWKNKLDWVADHGGMVLFNIHPDYVNIDKRQDNGKYPVKYYEEILEYIKSKYEGQYWNALPKDVARFWANNYAPIASPLSPVSLPLHPTPYTLAPCSSPRAPCTLIDPVNDPRWDQFVESHPFGLICHLSGWKQVLEESFPHMKGHYLAILNHDNNSIRAALPVFEIKSIFTGKRLVSIPFASNCDPLISSNEDMRELLDAAINLSIKLKCSRIEIRTLASWPLIQDDRIGSVVHNKSHQLSLEKTPEEIIKTFSRKARWTINQSLKKGFELQLAENERDLEEFYHLYVKTRKRLGLPPQPYLFFKLLWEKFSSSKHITLLLVRYEEQLVAGLLMFKFKDRCSWDYLAADTRVQNLNVNYFGVWEAIKLAHSEGYKIFDFGRTGINNAGLMSFKGRWGTKKIDLPQFYYPKKLCSNLNSPEESIAYNFIRNISKNVPDPMFQVMGNFMYRHLG